MFLLIKIFFWGVTYNNLMRKFDFFKYTGYLEVWNNIPKNSTRKNKIISSYKYQSKN